MLYSAHLNMSLHMSSATHNRKFGLLYIYSMSTNSRGKVDILSTESWCGGGVFCDAKNPNNCFEGVLDVN